jgi:hypothetical protein
LIPGTGAILRMTMEAELGWIREPNLNPVLPAKGAAMMVEYGPVEIGGRKYVCPHPQRRDDASPNRGHSDHLGSDI